MTAPPLTPPKVVTPPKDEAKKHWLVRRKTIKQLWIWGLVSLAVLAGLDVFIHPHPYFGIDGTFGFWSWYGFVTCIAMVVFAKVLGFALKRKDTYYDDQ